MPPLYALPNSGRRSRASSPSGGTPKGSGPAEPGDRASRPCRLPPPASSSGFFGQRARRAACGALRGGEWRQLSIAWPWAPLLSMVAAIVSELQIVGFVAATLASRDDVVDAHAMPVEGDVADATIPAIPLKQEFNHHRAVATAIKSGRSPVPPLLEPNRLPISGVIGSLIGRVRSTVDPRGN